DDALLLERLPHLSPHYSDIRVPVAIVTGDSDLIVPVNENARRLHEALPQSQLIVLKQAGHQIVQTRPDAVMAAIDSVAARIPGKRVDRVATRNPFLTLR